MEQIEARWPGAIQTIRGAGRTFGSRPEANRADFDRRVIDAGRESAAAAPRRESDRRFGHRPRRSDRAFARAGRSAEYRGGPLAAIWVRPQMAVFSGTTRDFARSGHREKPLRALPSRWEGGSRRRARRRKTGASPRGGGIWSVSIPARMTFARREHWVEEMCAGWRGAPPPLGSIWPAGLRLWTPATTCRRRRPYTGPPIRVGRWGSCTPADRTIPAFRPLVGEPGWVIDYVMLMSWPICGCPSTTPALGAGRALNEGRKGLGVMIARGLGYRRRGRGAESARARRCVTHGRAPTVTFSMSRPADGPEPEICGSAAGWAVPLRRSVPRLSITGAKWALVHVDESRRAGGAGQFRSETIATAAPTR